MIRCQAFAKPTTYGGGGQCGRERGLRPILATDGGAILLCWTHHDVYTGYRPLMLHTGKLIQKVLRK